MARRKRKSSCRNGRRTVTFKRDRKGRKLPKSKWRRVTFPC